MQWNCSRQQSRGCGGGGGGCKVGSGGPKTMGESLLFLCLSVSLQRGPGHRCKCGKKGRARGDPGAVDFLARGMGRGPEERDNAGEMPSRGARSAIRTAVWNPGLTSAKSTHLTFSGLPGTLRAELQADTARTQRTTGRAQEVRSHQHRTGCEDGAGPGTQATGQGETCTQNLSCGTPAHTR